MGNLVYVNSGGSIERRTMMKRMHIFFAMMIGVALLFANSEVRAEFADAVAPQRTCTAGSLVNVVAGPCLSGMTCDTTNPALARDFPRLVNCPAECDGAIVPGTSNLLSGLFLRWDILFTNIGQVSPSLIGTQVAADISIEAVVGNASASTPGIEESSLTVGQNDWDSRWLKFPGNSSNNQPFLASYFTQTGPKVRPEGIVIKSGKTIGSCMLAGAGSPSGLDPNQPFYIEETFTMPGPCTVNYSITPDCKAVPDSMQVVEGECTIAQTTEPIDINGYNVDFLAARCSTVAWMQPGSCTYCVPLTGGGKTCSTCSTCCIKASTGTCVKTSTLSSPATQCRPGTYTP
jgi:hypothetical protein